MNSPRAWSIVSNARRTGAGTATRSAPSRSPRAFFREHGHDEMMVRLDSTEGLAATYLGDYQRALKLFHAGLALAGTLHDQGQNQALLYLNIGYTHEKLGDYHQALAYFEPAHELMLARNETL